MGEENITYRLSADKFDLLANALDDTPLTVIPTHLLRERLCDVFIIGEPSSFAAVIIQSNFLPDELIGFGTDPEAMIELLKNIRGWTCVEVDPDGAPKLGKLIEKELEVNVRYLDDIFQTLAEPKSNIRNNAVRRLSVADLDLLHNAPSQLRGSGFKTTEELLLRGVVACAVESGKVVSTAHTFALSESYADVSVYTDSKYRKRGFSTTAADIVARQVHNSGRQSVWSCAVNNPASLRVAKKLGFSEVSRSTYVNLEKELPNGAK